MAGGSHLGRRGDRAGQYRRHTPGRDGRVSCRDCGWSTTNSSASSSKAQGRDTSRSGSGETRRDFTHRKETENGAGRQEVLHGGVAGFGRCHVFWGAGLPGGGRGDAGQGRNGLRRQLCPCSGRSHRRRLVVPCGGHGGGPRRRGGARDGQRTSRTAHEVAYLRRRRRRDRDLRASSWESCFGRSSSSEAPLSRHRRRGHGPRLPVRRHCREMPSAAARRRSPR